MQKNIFSARRLTSQDIDRADSFQIHSQTPEDFGKHFETSDSAEVTEWLNSKNPTNWRVSVWFGRSLLGEINGSYFVRFFNSQ